MFQILNVKSYNQWFGIQKVELNVIYVLKAGEEMGKNMGKS